MEEHSAGSSSGQVDITFTTTERGRRLLLRHGYMFNFHRETKIGTVWRCSNRAKCNATITILEAQTIRILNEAAHKCEPDKVKVDILKIKNQCKEKSAKTCKPIPKIYQETFQETKDADYSLLKAIPKLSNFSRTLYNVRNRQLNVPKTHFLKREEVIIPEKYQQFFMLFDDSSEPENRIIAFATLSAREVISTLETFMSDGTFSSCCTPFYQLYCIHGDVKSTNYSTNIIPLIYVLMPNQEQVSYERLFLLLKQNLPDWTPKTMVVDFEVAVINALRKTFPGIELQGCNFHFKKALAKKAHALKLNTAEEKRHVALCAALSHIKKEDIGDAWLYIMEKAPSTKEITDFNDYFVTQWLENKNVQNIWSVYGVRHRTNNLVEAWHKRLNNEMGKKKPRLLHFLDVLRKEAEYVDWKLKNLNCNIPLNSRQHSSIANDKQLAAVEENYNNMSLADVVEKIAALQGFKNW